MTDPIVEEPPLRTDNPEDDGTTDYEVSPDVQSFETRANVPCVITTTPGFEDGQPGYFVYIPYRGFFLDAETAKTLGQYFTAS